MSTQPIKHQNLPLANFRAEAECVGESSRAGRRIRATVQDDYYHSGQGGSMAFTPAIGRRPARRQSSGPSTTETKAVGSAIKSVDGGAFWEALERKG
jgi:hypothetical protein